MTIVPSDNPGPDDIGDVWWRISLMRRAGNTPVPLAGRSTSEDAALNEIVARARAYMEQDPGPYNDHVALHVSNNYVTVYGVPDLSLGIDEIVERIREAFAAKASEEAERERRQREIEATPVLSPTAPGSVNDAWNRITSWLTEHTDTPPEYRVPPVTDDDMSLLTGWPTEVVEFAALCSGAPSRLLPLNALMTPLEMARSRSSMQTVWSELESEEPEMVVPERLSQPAGTAAYSFLASYYPFAGLDGYFWFIDARPGALQGCVTEYSRDTADCGGPKWLSLSAMLSDLAGSLENGSVFDRMWLPRVRDGELEWDIRS
ncbi:hypothetical protein ACNHUS_36285 [Actinomycetes bacterium M1A6_2h]